MDFRRAFQVINAEFRTASIDAVLIGGFALAALGVMRTTGDLDFLVDGDRADDVDRIMVRLGYRSLHRSADAANYVGDSEALGQVDFLFANRAYSRAMMQAATPKMLLAGIEMRVAQAEDLIGLKVQSSSNNAARRALDMSDIAGLLASNSQLDLGRVREYFRLFDREAELDELLAKSKRELDG